MPVNLPAASFGVSSFRFLVFLLQIIQFLLSGKVLSYQSPSTWRREIDLIRHRGRVSLEQARHNVNVAARWTDSSLLRQPTQEQSQLEAIQMLAGPAFSGRRRNPSCFPARRMRSSRLRSATPGIAERTANADAR